MTGAEADADGRRRGRTDRDYMQGRGVAEVGPAEPGTMQGHWGNGQIRTCLGGGAVRPPHVTSRPERAVGASGQRGPAAAAARFRPRMPAGGDRVNVGGASIHAAVACG